MLFTLDLTGEDLNFTETTVERITDDDSPWRGTVRLHLAFDNAPSVTLYMMPEDAAYLAALTEFLLEEHGDE